MAALPQLKLEQVWKPSRSGFDTDVTLVTQLSLERYFNTPMPALHHLANMSVYLPN